MNPHDLAVELVILSENSLGFWFLSEKEMVSLLEEKGVIVTPIEVLQALKFVQIDVPSDYHQEVEIEEDFFEGF
jgi:hypothetical protein